MDAEWCMQPAAPIQLKMDSKKYSRRWVWEKKEEGLCPLSLPEMPRWFWLACRFVVLNITAKGILVNQLMFYIPKPNHFQINARL